VASSSQSCRIPYSSSGVLYSSAAASKFSPLPARVPSPYPPVICPSGVVAIFLSSPVCKNISLHPSGKSSLHIRAIPSHKRGVSRSSGNAGRDAVDAAASCVRWDRRAGFLESVGDVRHADERCCSVRRSRVVLTPRRWRQVRGCYVGPTGLQAQRWSVDDGGKRARSPGRARRKPLKPLRAGTPGDSGVLVYSCAFYHCKAHTRLRVQRASGVPHALLGRKIHAQLGPRREARSRMWT
jgi:hypothetical protein